MRKLSIVMGVFALLLTLSLGSVGAQNSGDILFSNVWARPTNMAMDMEPQSTPEAGMDMGDDDDMMPIPPSAAYMLIENTSDTDIRLIAGASPVAGVIEIHETTVEDDVMRMAELEDGITIPAGESATLEQGGLHVMMMDLQRDLLPGDALPLTLTFTLLEDDAPTGDPFDILIGAPVLERNPEQGNDLIVMNPRARATLMAGMEMDMDDENAPPPPPSAIYMGLLNLSGVDDVLVAAETSVAGLVEIHETTIEDDVMRMAELEGGLPLPDGETVVLEQGGLHIMLLDLQTELVEGEAISVTLIFESGTELVIGVPLVTDVGGMMGMDMDE